MKLTKKKASFLIQTLHDWKSQGLLPEEETKKLIHDIEVIPFDWKLLAKYSFRVSLVCIVTAVASIFADQALLELLQRIFDAAYFIKCLSFSAAAAGFYFWGISKKKKHPEKVYSNESILFLGILSTAGAVYQLGRTFDNGSGHFSVLLLLSSIVYGFLGLYFRSNLIWVFSLLSLGSWMGAETGYASGWGAYYLGMNYPLRFVLFGFVLTVVAYLVKDNQKFSFFKNSTLTMGLSYLFISLWILSIFGNYGDPASWETAKPIELFHWSILFAAASGGAIYYGLKFDHRMTKNFGITFLFINLYTRFFEYFWNDVHKAIFFSILAVSFWVLGVKAEKIWSLGEKKLELNERV